MTIKSERPKGSPSVRVVSWTDHSETNAFAAITEENTDERDQLPSRPVGRSNQSAVGAERSCGLGEKSADLREPSCGLRGSLNLKPARQRKQSILFSAMALFGDGRANDHHM